MGAAKLRQEAIETGAPAEYIDAFTNEKRTGRRAPSALVLAKQVALSELNADKQYVSKVPCNGCVACCYHRKVDFDAAKEDANDLAHLDYVADDNPDFIEPVKLRKRDDGGCIHLGPHGCTVYEHRPKPCRMYDCRFASVAGIQEQFNGHHPPVWIPDAHSDEDFCFNSALLLATSHMKDQGGEHNGKSSFELAIAAYNQAFQVFPDIWRMQQALMRQVRGLPRRERKRLRTRLKTVA